MGETSTPKDQNQASRDCVNTVKIPQSTCPTDDRNNLNKIRIEITGSITPFINDYLVSLKDSSSFDIDREIMFLGVSFLTKLDKDNYIWITNKRTMIQWKFKKKLYKLYYSLLFNKQ